MCNFLSLVETERHKLFFFIPYQRMAHAKKPLTDKHGNAYRMDSHASICAFYGLDEDAVNKYEWNPYTRKLTIDEKVFDVDEDRVQKELDEIDWHPICGDIEGLRAFCDRMKEIPFFKRCGRLPDGVKLFKDRDAASDATSGAAWDSAWDSAWNAVRASARAADRASAWDSAWDVAWDAACYARIIYVCDDMPIDANHIEHMKKRWSVWEAGYGVYCDVDGVLYCYERP